MNSRALIVVLLVLPLVCGAQSSTLPPTSDVPGEVSASSRRSSPAQPQPDGIIAGRLIHKEDPKYPKVARKQKLQGRVLLQVTVEENGTISIVNFISGEPTLGHAALDVVQKWKFEPFTQNGHPLRVQQKLVLNFAPGNKVAELELPLPAPTEGGPSPPRGVYRVGGGVSAPKAIYNPDPEYSEEARRAKYQGVCVLAVILGPDGLPWDIRVARPLGMGLDEKAIEAIKRWRFQPAQKDGRPVAVAINIEVQFRL